MSAKILIEPHELRDAARRMRAAATPRSSPSKKKDGGGLLDTVGEVTGINDAGKAFDAFEEGRVLDGLGNTVLAVRSVPARSSRARRPSRAARTSHCA